MAIDRVALLHIPKTGGTSAASSPLIAEFGHTMVYDVEGTAYNYLYMYQDPPRAKKVNLPIEHTNKWYVISIVRNHFDWLVSYADWCCCFNNWNPLHYDAKYGRKGFEYFIRHIMNRDDRWPCRKFIFCQNFTPTGRWVPDHIFHTGSLDDELRAFFKKQGKVYVPAPRQQIGRAKLANQRPPKSELYRDDKLVCEILDCWGLEMSIYGMEEGPFDIPAMIGAIADKEQYRYVWNTNTLSINKDNQYYNLNGIITRLDNTPIDKIILENHRGVEYDIHQTP
jgi:hypothetical protein